MVATAKIKIKCTPEILKTYKIYSKCLQFCVDSAWENRIKNNVKLHPFVYPELRSFGLPSQLAIACIKQVCGMVKKAKSKPIVKRISIGYNFPRSASLRWNLLSLTTVKGRQMFSIDIPYCYERYFKNWTITESLLRIDKKDRCFFLFTFSRHNFPNDNLKNETLGIDLGINNLAATSNNKLFKSSKAKNIKRKFKYLRSKLQAKGTKSTKNLLKKISGKEKRFMAWVNHNISRQIVSKFNGNRIVMENLNGIRKMRRGKKMNYWISNWSFYQLQKFIKYKAGRKGLIVDFVDPIYTSKTCSSCGNFGSRSKGFFHCHCGFSLNADLNASRNLAKGISYSRQGDVNPPHIPSDDTKASFDELRQSLGINNHKSVMSCSLL